MRRVRLGTALGVALVTALSAVAGATAAHAVWQARAALPVGTVTTGDLQTTAAWKNGTTPSLTAVFPTQTVTTGTNPLRVTVTGPGTTLRWKVSVAATLTPLAQNGASPAATVQAWAGACDTGTLIPATGYLSSTALRAGDTVEICLKVTLAATAPSSLMGKPLLQSVTVTVDQRST